MNRLYLFDLLKGLDFLEEHFRTPVRAVEVSKAAGYSPWHYSRIFQQYLGESISQYLLRRRLEEGKKELRRGRSVEETAFRVGFRSREGFTKAFCTAYGISPGRYARGEEIRERYTETYEYRMSAALWDAGINPTADGLWEFSYRDPSTGECRLMRWSGKFFEAPYRRTDVDDPAWYCRNRYNGYGMHPGKEIEAVKSFVCPKSGVLEYFLSLGRVSELYDGFNPCSVRLMRNDALLYPSDGPMILTGRQPVFFQGRVRVRKGDRIRICVNSMGDIGRDGIMLYRQYMGYLGTEDDPV